MSEGNVDIHQKKVEPKEIRQTAIYVEKYRVAATPHLHMI